MLNFYKYYSPGFESNCLICYEDGAFKSLEIEKPVPFEVAKKSAVYKQEANFLEVMKEHKVKLTKVDRDITFEMFYEKYDYKVKRVAAEKAWNKLTKAEKQEAYDHIPAYKNRKKLEGTAMEYPATFLNQKTFVK